MRGLGLLSLVTLHAAGLVAGVCRADEPPAAPPLEVSVVGEPPLKKDRSQDAVIVRGQRLRESPRASTLEALAQEAGDVYVSGRGAGIHGISSGASGGVHIRGLGGSPNDQVLVVDNGAPDYQGIFGHPIPDAYVPFLLDQVLVVKGGDSVLYGTNAMAGVIVLRNRRREQDGFEVENDTAVGSYATVRESAAMLARQGPWDLAGAVTALKTDGHRAGAGGSSVVGQVSGRYRTSFGVDIVLADRLVHLVGADPGPASHPSSDHGYDVRRNNLSGRIDVRRGALRFSVAPYFNAGVHRLYDGAYLKDYTGGLSAEATFEPRPPLSLLVGFAAAVADGSFEDRIERTTTTIRAQADYAAYSQMTLRPVEGLSIVLGSRELLSVVYGPVLLYKAGVRWDIGRGFHVRTRVARNFRQPTLRELYLPFPTANPNLEPERSLTWDFGGGFSSELADLGCTGYRTEAGDLIKYFGVWPTAEVVNIDRVVVWGVEGHAALKRLGPLGVFVTAAYQDVGRYTRQNPRAKLDFRLDARKQLGDHFVGASVSGEWVHGLYMADYARHPIPDVFFVDLALRYRHSVAARGMSVEPYLFVRNLLDRSYAYVEDYPMPGLNVLAGLKLGM